MLRPTPVSLAVLALAFLLSLPRTASGQAQSLEGGYRRGIAAIINRTGSATGTPFLGFRLAHSRWPFLGLDLLVAPPATAVQTVQCADPKSIFKTCSFSENTYSERSVQGGLSFRISPRRPRPLFVELAVGRSWVTSWEKLDTWAIDGRHLPNFSYETGRTSKKLAYIRLGAGVRGRLGSHGPLLLASVRHQWSTPDFLDADYYARKGIEVVVGIGI